MTSQIKTIEEALCAEIERALEKRVRTIEWAPPDWDEDFIKRVFLQLPGVFVIFNGCTAIEPGSTTLRALSNWTVVAAAKYTQDPKRGAHGDSKEIGCYEMCEVLAPTLDGLTVPDVGRLTLVNWDNSASLKLEKQALLVHSLEFTMPITLPRTLDPSVLRPFKIFHATYDVGQQPGASPTEDHLELPQ